VQNPDERHVDAVAGVWRTRSTLRARLAFAVVSLAAAACSSDPEPSDHAGGAGGATTSYPAGPYGQTVGTTLADECFEGVLDPPSTGFSSAGNTRSICLGDFYNPGAADPTRPKVLVVLLGATWCTPCQHEAASATKNRAYWAPHGVELMTSVYQGTTGAPATLADLDAWTKAYALDYPTVLDPTAKLLKYFSVGAFPDNLVIDATTMTILYASSGETDFGPSNPVLRAATGI
jgi:thiol-disulfide isomerase/thioredoxin